MRKSSRFGVLVAVGLMILAAVPADGQEPNKPVQRSYSINIEGLTCEMCSASAKKGLATVPGVVKSVVDWKAGHALVTIQIPQKSLGDKTRNISTELAQAVHQAGAGHGNGFKPTVNYMVAVSGMTCDACAAHVKEALAKVPGVKEASVNFKGGYAVVTPSVKQRLNVKALVPAIEGAGYKAVIHSGPTPKN